MATCYDQDIGQDGSRPGEPRVPDDKTARTHIISAYVCSSDQNSCRLIEALQIRYTHATRMSEGKLVAIRSVQTDGLEIRIAMFLGTPPLSEDPANHCVRILDTFEDETDPSTSYIVIPFLRRYDDPVFESVEDVVDFGEQAH